MVQGATECGDDLTSVNDCEIESCRAFNNTWLLSSLCQYRGVPAAILAFEQSELWTSRLKDFNLCTGARVSLTYNGDGTGSEDLMEDDLRADIGAYYIGPNDVPVSTEAAGLNSYELFLDYLA